MKQNAPNRLIARNRKLPVPACIGCLLVLRMRALDIKRRLGCGESIIHARRRRMGIPSAHHHHVLGRKIDTTALLQLHRRGLGFKRIAKAMGVPHRTIRRHLRKRGLRQPNQSERAWNLGLSFSPKGKTGSAPNLNPEKNQRWALMEETWAVKRSENQWVSHPDVRQWYKERREAAYESYLKSAEYAAKLLISGTTLSVNDIPPELAELKLAELTAKRRLKRTPYAYSKHERRAQGPV